MAKIQSSAPADGIAFALGGLGGSNAHGAGFLQAARDAGVRPAMISCTSGTILWVAHYLAGDDLVAVMRRMAEESNLLPAPWQDFNSVWLTATGLPGIFRPAWPEYWLRWFTPPAEPTPKALTDRMLPAQMWVPTRPPEFFGFVAQTLRASDVGVVFNSYNPQLAVEYLYINEALRQTLHVEYGDSSDAGAVYRPITPEAVEASLWLFGYGYGRNFEGEVLVDGAYHRQFILSELCEGPRTSKPGVLYVVRPQNLRWLGSLPGNQFEQQDLQTELFFNASYVEQTSRIELINRLVRQGKLKDGYREVSLQTLEIDLQRGFFEYFVEKQEVFDQARARGQVLLAAPQRAAA